jgi:hypothetical protein
MQTEDQLITLDIWKTKKQTTISCETTREDSMLNTKQNKELDQVLNLHSLRKLN